MTPQRIMRKQYLILFSMEFGYIKKADKAKEATQIILGKRFLRIKIHKYWFITIPPVPFMALSKTSDRFAVS